jgi:hypothetical protein
VYSGTTLTNYIRTISPEEVLQKELIKNFSQLVKDYGKLEPEFLQVMLEGWHDNAHLIIQ